MPDYWGDEPQREPSARTISTRSATSTTATPPSCSKPSRATGSTSASRTVARNWATGYDFPAVQEGRVVLEEFPSALDRHHAGLRVQPAPRQVQGPAGAARLQPRLRLRGHQPHPLLRPLPAHQLATSTALELASSGLPEGQELAILETVRDKVPPAVFTTPYANPVSGSPEAVRANLREAVGSCARPATSCKDASSSTADGRAASRSSSSATTRTTSATSCPTSQALERLGIAVSVRIVDAAQYRTGCAASTSTSSRTVWAQIALARQRAARLLGLGRGRPAGLAQPRRHQGPGRRRAHRQGDLRQGPGRARRRDARPSTGCCSPTTTWCRNGRSRMTAHRALEPLRPPRDHAALRQPRLPDDLVVRSGPGRQDRSAAMRHPTRRRVLAATGAAAAGGSRRAAVPAAASAPALPSGETETHGLSSFGDLKYAARLHAFRLRQPEGAEGRHAGDPDQADRSATRTSTPSTPSTSSSCKGDGAAGMPADLRHPDGRLGRRAGLRSTASWRGRVRVVRRQADLPLPPPAGGALPRRLAADRAGRRLLADDPRRRRAIRPSARS